MTNYEKMKPHFVALFGNGIDLTPELCATIYAQAMEDSDCGGCMIGLTLCDHMNGQITYEEAIQKGMTEDEIDDWFCDTGYGMSCEEIVLKWLNSEAEES